MAALERMRDAVSLFDTPHGILLDGAIAQSSFLTGRQRVEPRASKGLIQRELLWHSAAIDPRFEEAVRRGRALLLTQTGELSHDAPLCIAMAASGEEGYVRRVKLLAPLVR